MIAGSSRSFCGFGESRQGMRGALRGQGARVVVTEIVRSARSGVGGFEVKTLGASSQGRHLHWRPAIATYHRQAHVADERQGVVANIGHFDNESTWPVSKISDPGSTSSRNTMNSFDGHSVLILAEGVYEPRLWHGHPSFVMSALFRIRFHAQCSRQARASIKAGLRAAQEARRGSRASAFESSRRGAHGAH
jgi:S-adenosylhomocysteine hydrolase